MRLIIAGSRSCVEDSAIIEEALKASGWINEPIIAILSGKCSGADKAGELFALKFGFNIEDFPAQWTKHGRKAGKVRNRLMAINATHLLLIWDGKSSGSKNMLVQAARWDVKIFVYRIDPDPTKAWQFLLD